MEGGSAPVSDNAVLVMMSEGVLYTNFFLDLGALVWVPVGGGGGVLLILTVDGSEGCDATRLAFRSLKNFITWLFGRQGTYAFGGVSPNDIL